MSEEETELLIVPHTHWDREWYLTFQQFRMKLVDTVDRLLDILESDPAFSFFMLDGQTIILEDYLELRPENAERLQRLARQGRILLGPWYLQPDEFLVSGESLIRNLQKGLRMANAYGGAMPIGYVPDTFGHIAQLPQLLRGFGIDNAVFWRGVWPEVNRDSFHWRAPDGSDVLVAWLHDDTGYSNAVLLPLAAEALATRLQLIASRMRPYATTSTLLLMNGSDHQMPQAGLPAAIAAANAQLRDSKLHARIGTLPQYIAQLREANGELPTYEGEMTSSYSAHLLPGVYSSRMWIKQRNAAGEALLTRWTEPATCLAWLLGERYPGTELQLAWKFLLHNHPHDSICGCSIDQVHAEMMTRFAQSEQIASELTRRALQAVASNVTTRGPERSVPVVVFNAAGGPRTDVVRCAAQVNFTRFQVVDDEGMPLPHQVLARDGAELLNQTADKSLVLGMLGIISEGQALGYTLLDAHLGAMEEGGVIPIEIVAAQQGTPNLPAIEELLARVRELAEQDDVAAFRVIAHEAPTTDFIFLARDVPSFGGRTFFIQPNGSMSGHTERQPSAAPVVGTLRTGPNWIENAHLRVEVDSASGTMQLHDKATGSVYAGLHQFIDSGDVGDLYTYCPPAQDTVIAAPEEAPTIELVEHGPARATLQIRQTYCLPSSCTADRAARSAHHAPCAIVTEVSLGEGSRRVEFRTTVENTASDHRLRVFFPAPFVCESVDVEGSFAVTRRPARQQPPQSGERPWSEWMETPVNTHPQKRFADLSNGESGLAVLNRGLAEYEVVQTEQGSALALTLLRCTGWLSRDDLSTRRGHAGPPLQTPEAQGIGTHTFEYALVPHAGTWQTDDAFVLQEAQAYEAPLRAAVTTQHGGRLPAAWSFVQVAPASVAVSAIKRADTDDGLILRLYNPLAEHIEATITLAVPFETVELVDLAEQKQRDETATPLARNLSTGVRTTIRGGAIQTLRFGMAPSER
jgi:alpha-mannosidase